MHFEHRIIVPNEKNACIPPQKDIHALTWYYINLNLYYELLYRKSPILKQHG